MLHHLVLPAFTLAIIYLAQYSRLARASMLDVLGADYIRTARAKGLGETRSCFKHALRNAVLPIVTVVGLQFGNLLSGAMLVETVFNWPGMGRLAFESVLRRDYPAMLGILFFSALMVVVANILTDLSYRLVDPRIRTAAAAMSADSRHGRRRAPRRSARCAEAWQRVPPQQARACSALAAPGDRAGRHSTARLVYAATRSRSSGRRTTPPGASDRFRSAPTTSAATSCAGFYGGGPTLAVGAAAACCHHGHRRHDRRARRLFRRLGGRPADARHRVLPGAADAAVRDGPDHAVLATAITITFAIGVVSWPRRRA